MLTYSCAILLTHLVAEMHLSVFIPAFRHLTTAQYPHRIQETQYPFDACAEV